MIAVRINRHQNNQNNIIKEKILTIENGLKLKFSP